MTGIMLFGIIALVAIMVTMMMMAYRSRFAGGADDETLKRGGRWYRVRQPRKQSVITDTRGDLVHQDGSTAHTAVGETVEVVNKTTGEAYTTKTPGTYTKGDV